MSAEKIMEQAQVFASAWSVVGGPFDDGAAMEVAAQEKDELKRMVGVLAAERDALAAKLAELEGQEPVAWVEVVSPHEGPYNFEGMALLGKGTHHLYARPVPAEMSPDFTDTARAALLWVLWHHQGGSSPVGQPIRYALGMDAHEHMSKHQVQEAKRWAALTKSESNDFRQARTAPPEPVNTRLLTALKACRHQFAQYVAHHISKGDMHKAMANEAMVAMADVAIMAADAAPRVARLTADELRLICDRWADEDGATGQTGRTFLARAIETAVLRKNGLALED